MRKELIRKQELAEKVNLQFDEVSDVFSLETLETMYMVQILGGSGTNTVASCGCDSNTVASCGCTNTAAQCGCSSGSSGGKSGGSGSGNSGHGSGNLSGNTVNVGLLAC